jgi:histidinol phosphatase-like PHP family hydrolase
VECTRLPPVFNKAPLDTLGYPLTTSSDAHYPEHVARRPFELDISMEELLPHGLAAEADMEALTRALAKRPTF